MTSNNEFKLMSNNYIKSNAINVHKLIHTCSSKLRIPFFQRQYVWEFKNEIKQLINDILSNLEDVYFLGSIILKNDANSGEIIIDGQQRITTIMLILFALYTNKNLDDEYKNEINNFFSYFNFQTYNIQNSEILNEIWYFIKNNKIDQTLKNSNYYLIFEEIQKYFNNFSNDKINDFFDKLTYNCIFSKITIISNINENLIFSKINSTGKTLTAFEMMKNDLLYEFMKFYENDKSFNIDKFINEKNNEMNSLVEKIKEKSMMLRSFYAFNKYELINKDDKNIFNSFLNLKNNYFYSNKNINDLFNDLTYFIKYWNFYTNNLINEKFLNNHELEIIKSRFRTYSTLLIFLLKQYSHFDEYGNISFNDNNLNDFKKSLKMIEWYIISREFGGYDEKTITRKIPQFIKEMNDFRLNALNILEKLYYILYYLPNNQENNKVLSYRSPSDIEIENNFLEREIYNKNRDFTKSFLIRIISNDFKYRHDFSKQSIEHFLPNKYEDSWLVSLEDKDKIDHYKNTIGNLTLTIHNSQYSNYSFNDKKKLMKENKDEYHINHFFINKDKWDIFEIRNRSNEILNVAKTIWNFDYINTNKFNLINQKENDILNCNFDNFYKNLSYYKKIIFTKELILKIIKLHLINKYSYEKIELKLFNTSYDGWVPCAIFDALNINKKTQINNIDEWFNSTEIQEIIDYMINYVKNN